ncbi:mfs monocarboxylate [Moniliophthora roreri MCA 2997]|uniref:Mfs monocarboxylate n=1 Tax=Moniliophthora roreri (strain MCA 2997) TaxID=1381753 RepID=V2WMQ4_MONRO|nr:mfs monocarboxylate [Moniliophthora roreri MCA 2997]
MQDTIELKTHCDFITSSKHAPALSSTANASGPSRSETPTRDDVSRVEQAQCDEHLPPVDRGVNAWSFCAAAFAIEFLFWGPQSSFGTFQSYYESNAPFNQSSSTAIATIGTTGLALEYGAGILLMALFQRHPQHLRVVMYFGLLLWLTGTFSASFASSVWQLIICQGVMPGLSAAIISFPTYIWVTQWFAEKRGLASGLIITGASLGGVCLPLTLDALLQRLGFAWTMRVWTLFTAVVGLAALHFARPRLPPGAMTRGAYPVFSFRTLFRGRFIAALASLLQAAGYFPVTVFLPTQASQLGISNPNIVLSALNLASIPGRLGFGKLSDMYGSVALMAISSAASAVLAFLLYGFANGLAMLLAFSLLFGVIAGGYSSMWAQAARDMSSKEPEYVPVLYSALFVARGIGCIVGPIIASVLYHPSGSTRTGLNGSSYGLYDSGVLSIFIGSLLAVSAIVGLAGFVSKLSARRGKN